MLPVSNTLYTIGNVDTIERAGAFPGYFAEPSMYQTMIGLTPLERVHSGRPVAQALADEAETIGAKRVFLVCSNTLNNKTDEIDKVRRALGARLVGVFDQVRPHVPREDVSAAVAAAEPLSPGPAGVDRRRLVHRPHQDPCGLPQARPAHARVDGGVSHRRQRGPHGHRAGVRRARTCPS